MTSIVWIRSAERAHRPDLAEADARDRDHDHEEGVEQGPAQRHVAEDAQARSTARTRREPQQDAPDRAALPEAGRDVGRGSVLSAIAVVGSRAVGRDGRDGGSATAVATACGQPRPRNRWLNATARTTTVPSTRPSICVLSMPADDDGRSP